MSVGVCHGLRICLEEAGGSSLYKTLIQCLYFYFCLCSACLQYVRRDESMSGIHPPLSTQLFVRSFQVSVSH